MYLKETGWVGVNWIRPSQDKDQSVSCENNNEPLSSKKEENFLTS
jgi:hypothetical protein